MPKEGETKTEEPHLQSPGERQGSKRDLHPQHQADQEDQERTHRQLPLFGSGHDLFGMQLPRRDIFDIPPRKGPGEFAQEQFWPWYVLLQPTAVRFDPRCFIDRRNLSRRYSLLDSATPKQRLRPGEIVYLYQVLPAQHREDTRRCYVNAWDLPLRMSVRRLPDELSGLSTLVPATYGELASRYREIYDLWLRTRFRLAGLGREWLVFAAERESLVVRSIHIPVYRAFLRLQWQKRLLKEPPSEGASAWAVRELVSDVLRRQPRWRLPG